MDTKANGSELGLDPALDDAGEAARMKPGYICDRCGATMVERNCKIICTNCGHRFDCSDLNIYLD